MIGNRGLTNINRNNLETLAESILRETFVFLTRKISFLDRGINQIIILVFSVFRSTNHTTQEPPLGRPTCTLPAVRRAIVTAAAAAAIVPAVAIMVQERLARRRAHRRLSHLCLLHLRRTFSVLLHRPHIIIHRCPRAHLLPQHRWIICTTLLQLAHLHRTHRTRPWD